ncbi:MAG: hypothetical protein V1914_02420 [archaeon]
MNQITENEMRALLVLFKDVTTDYNANNISKKLGLTAMGALKILKKLEKQKLIKSKQMGKAVFYKANLGNSYTKNYFQFLLRKEAEETEPKIKRWVKELRKLQNNTQAGILFGSILGKGNPNDVDILLILKQSQNKQANQTLTDINKLTHKKIHAVKQTKNDLIENIKNKDKVIINALKNSVALYGYEDIMEVMQHATL